MNKLVAGTGQTQRPWEDMNSGVIRSPIPPELLGTATISPDGAFDNFW